MDFNCGTLFQWVINSSKCDPNFPTFSAANFEIFRFLLNFRKKWQDIEILVGTTKLQPGSGTRLKINQPIIHEQFGYPPFSHDLALIPLQKPIEFDGKVQPIKISAKVVPAGAKLQVFGWGLLWDDGLSPIDLQVLNVASISDEVCKLQSPKTAHESHLCTLSPDGEGVCTVCQT